MNEYQKSLDNIKSIKILDDGLHEYFPLFNEDNLDIQKLQELVDKQKDIEKLYGYRIEDLVALILILKEKNISPLELNENIDYARMGFEIANELARKQINEAMDRMVQRNGY